MIDLTVYSPKKIAYLRECGAHCLYAVGPADAEPPTKIGIAFDMPHRMASMQVGNWHALSCHFLLWAPGKEATRRIESEIHKLLKDRLVSGEWFNIPVLEAKEIISKMARQIYPTLKFFEHDEMINWLRSQPIDKRDHVKKLKKAS